MFLKLLFPTDNLCYCCKDDTPFIKNFLCIECRERMEELHRSFNLDSPYIQKVYVSMFYNNFVRDFIHKFKFQGKSYLFEPFGLYMLRTLEKNGLGDFDYIIPVPIHFRKEAIRGYNQSYLLAKIISEGSGIPILRKCLVKSRWTKEQIKLSAYERKKNLKDSFKVKNPQLIQGKKLLLVDDILTTGSTMVACSQELIISGAASIIGITLTTARK